MKFLLFFLIFISSLFSNEILSKNKKQNFYLKEKEIKLKNEILRKSWINPINLSISTNNNFTNSSNHKVTNQAQIMINQDIFRSGGIFYSIDYANSLESLELKNLQIDKNFQSILAFLNLANIQKIILNIKKQKLFIKNTTIDIKRKQEQYLAGLLDISFLNNAILQKTNLQDNLIGLEKSLQTSILDFQKLSDKDYKKVKLPKLKIPKKSDFLNKNLYINAKEKQISTKQNFTKLTTAKYLPKLSINANYTKQNINNHENSEHYSYTLRLSMPFDINQKKDIEAKKLSVMIAQNELISLREDKSKEYENYLQILQNLDKKITLSLENIKLYDALLIQSKEQVNAGFKTKEDLEIMKNSQEIKHLETQIFKIQKQEITLKLYENLFLQQI